MAKMDAHGDHPARSTQIGEYWHGRASRMVLALGFAYLLAAWSAVLLIDVLNVAGIRTRLESGLEMPMIWWHLFREGSPTQVLQWTLNGATALVASRYAGWLAASRHRPVALVSARRFLTLLSVTMMLMLIEDAGSSSHRLAGIVMGILGDNSYLIELTARLPVFILIAAIPLYAFVRYWPSVGFRRPGGGLLLGGFVVYAVAAFSSQPANIFFDFYTRMGPFVTDRLFAGRMLTIERTLDWQLRFSAEEFTGTLFMDFVYEESLELIGAVLFLAGVLAFSGHIVTTTADVDGDMSAPGEAAKPGS